MNQELLDDLCILNTGWRTPLQHQRFLLALKRVSKHGNQCYREHEIQDLKQRLETLTNADTR